MDVLTLAVLIILTANGIIAYLTCRAVCGAVWDAAAWLDRQQQRRQLPPWPAEKATSAGEGGRST